MHEHNYKKGYMNYRQERRDTRAFWVLVAFVTVGLVTLYAFGVVYAKSNTAQEATMGGEVKAEPPVVETNKEYEHSRTITATVTAYNSVEEQNDSSPCVGAGGYICGNTRVVACPRSIALGTWVRIGDDYYQCLDRLSKRYDSRFDIFFDKDIAGAIKFGKQRLEVKIYE